MAEVLDRLREPIAGYLGAESVELYDLELIGRGKAKTLRVTVDVTGGVDVDRLAELSRGLSRLLDEDETLAGPYSLEVTSPGLERRLRRPEHYRGAVGSEVIVKTREGETVRGELEASTGDTVTLRADGATQQIHLEDVKSARTVFRWQGTAKPGGKGK